MFVKEEEVINPDAIKQHFLRVSKGNGNNAAIRYVRFLKKVTRVALANKWLEEDPFIDKHYSRTTTNRGFLTEDEVKRISRMLGHADIRTTQIYAKTQDKTIYDDMASMRHKFDCVMMN